MQLALCVQVVGLGRQPGGELLPPGQLGGYSSAAGVSADSACTPCTAPLYCLPTLPLCTASRSPPLHHDCAAGCTNQHQVLTYAADTVRAGQGAVGAAWRAAVAAWIPGWLQRSTWGE
jgi:hypothetical protein